MTTDRPDRSDRPGTHPPRPPAELWGLWVTNRGGGYWLNHTNGPHRDHPAPMTWTSREDAERAAEYEMEDDDSLRAEGELYGIDSGGEPVLRLVVARIGVAPPGDR